MSQTETQPATRKGVATRTVVLLIIIAGLSAGAAAFAFTNASANTNNPSTAASTSNYNGQWFGLRGAGPLGLHDGNRSITSFRAASTIANVSVTGFNIVNSNTLTVTLSYTGTGTAPEATIVVVAPGLSGSNTVSAGWSSPTTASIALVGSGSLSSTMTCVRVLVVPLTGS
jgi:hypothetical protein